MDLGSRIFASHGSMDGNLLDVPGLRKSCLVMAREMMIVLVMMMMMIMGIGMIEHDEFATSVRTTRWADMPGPSRRSQTKERRGSSLQPGTPRVTHHIVHLHGHRLLVNCQRF